MDDMDRLEEKAALRDVPVESDGLDAFSILRQKDPGRHKLVAAGYAEIWLCIPGWTRVGEVGSNVRIEWTGEGEPRVPMRVTPVRKASKNFINRVNEALVEKARK